MPLPIAGGPNSEMARAIRLIEAGNSACDHCPGRLANGQRGLGGLRNLWVHLVRAGEQHVVLRLLPGRPRCPDWRQQEARNRAIECARWGR
jgi:hypothetical protein